MPTVPLDRDDVETESVGVAEATAMLSDLVALLLLASVTLTVKDEVPDAVGVPEIAPVEAFSVSPAGSEPLLTLHE